MDEPHLLAAARYVELNPVRAGLCGTAARWPWSSARAHLQGTDDVLVAVKPMLQMVPNWRKYLCGQNDESTQDSFRLHSRTGGPLGTDSFLEHVEKQSGRQLRLRKPGRQAKV